MKKYDVIILGAGPAGIITGVTAKSAYPEKSMLMLREEDKGLVPCGIPYVFHELNNVEKNIMGPKAFIDMGGEVLTDPAVNVDFDEKSVETKSGEKFNYDKLVFATGSRAIEPNFIPGFDLNNVFYIRKSYNYITHVFNELKDKKHIVVVGGGFIGAEVAEQLAKQEGKKVSLIESEANCFSKAFSPELSALATDELRKSDIDVRTLQKVKEIQGTNGNVKGVLLENGETIQADAVIMAIGYKPNTELAAKSSLELNSIGAIRIDNYSRTSVKDVCAVGDCAQTIGFLTGRTDSIMLASTATAEARVLGHNLFGIQLKKTFTGTLAIFSTEINGLAMASCGVNDKNADEANIEFVSAVFTDFDRHPATFLDTKETTVKLYASPHDGSIIGGEVWGGKSAGEIINTISLAIQKHVTVYELVSFQIGTHPLLTGAPTRNALIKAAEICIKNLKK